MDEIEELIRAFNTAYSSNTGTCAWWDKEQFKKKLDAYIDQRVDDRIRKASDKLIENSKYE